MVHGAINEKGESYYTHLGKIFHAIGNTQNQFNWLITDCDCVPNEIFTKSKGKDYCWLSGEALTAIVRGDDSQWVWAVLSGFKKDIALQDILQYPLPYADGYTGFWENPLTIQHPLADIEIVPWDSSLTLFFSKKKRLVEDFMKFFPQSEDLSTHNTR